MAVTVLAGASASALAGAGAGKGTALIASAFAVSAFSALAQGFAQKRAADFQAAILTQQAARDRQQAASDEEDFRRRQSRAFAARRAQLGASGVEPGAGSPLLVSEDFVSETELGALNIRSGGETRATRLEQQAVLQRFKGRAARTAGFIRGGALLLTGAGKTFGRNQHLPHEHD